MTNLLLKLFIKPDHPDRRGAIGRLSGAVGILCNAVLVAGKLLIGFLSGSVSVTADALNNLTDVASSVVTLVGFKLAGKPADSEHPYGHARYEYLAALVVAALILVIGFELVFSSVEKIFHPAPVALSIPMAIALGGAVLLKLWMYFFNRKLGKDIDSRVLLATSVDSLSDVVTTSAVLAAGILEMVTSWPVDGYMGLCVAVFIIRCGLQQAKDTISPLLGEAVSMELREDIVKVVTSDPHVLGYHDLMVHDYGPGQRFASIHVEMDQKEDPLMCHEIIDDLERACLEQHKVHLVIHYDPVAVGDAELECIKCRVCGILQEMDPRLTVHDFRMVKGANHSNLIFDVTLPGDLQDRQMQIKHQLESALAAGGQGTYNTVITFDLI